METQLKHITYKIVTEAEADAVGWAFVDTENVKKIYFKFPELKPTEVRAKVHYCGLCQSDCHMVRNEWEPCSHPIVPGHEIVAVVTQVGSQVKDLKAGDKVGFGPQRDCCDECEFCKEGDDNICVGKVDQGLTYGDLYWGGYASHIQQPGKFFFKIPDGLPDEQLGPLFCAGLTTYTPIATYAKPGQEVAVLGVGGLGHLAVMYARAWGCKVTGFTTTKGKETFIKQLGADRVVVTTDETLRQEAGKYHLILNTLPDGQKLTSYVALARPKGIFVQLGGPEVSKPCPFNPLVLAFYNIKFVGSKAGSRKDARAMLEFSAKHKIFPICEEYEFEDLPKAYEKILNGKPYFRCVVNMKNVFKDKAPKKRGLAACLFG